jgi:hypothetical protein
MKFGFIAKHRGTWPVRWLCEAPGVSRSGFHGWLTRPRSARARSDEELTTKVRASFVAFSLLIGVWSRRRSARQAVDLTSFAGVPSWRLFTILEDTA